VRRVFVEEDSMPIDRRTLEQIETCRPGSDDLQLPEVSEARARIDADSAVHALYAKSQRFDSTISRAMHDVAVPDGLADRLLARLAMGRAAALAASEGPSTVENAVVTPLSCDVSPAVGGWSRRGLLAIVSTVAATVVVGVYVARYLQSDADASVESLADTWLAELDANWVGMDQAPRNYVVPAAITAEATGWQRIHSLGRFLGVAYRLESPRAGAARLFVVRLAKSGLPSSPPVKPQWTTGGRSIGYWQSGELTFVLVVEGNEDNYRSFANVSRMPIA
jgi:hypothetical protein